MRLTVEHISEFNLDSEHLFEAHCLRAQLKPVGFAGFRRSAFVFDRRRHPSAIAPVQLGAVFVITSEFDNVAFSAYSKL